MQAAKGKIRDGGRRACLPFALSVVALSVISFFIPLPVFASIPLPSSPSWTSSDNDYSTGGAFADINGDGWLDFLVSNGNDMEMDSNSVYMNNAGTLGTVASWRSSDVGFFGQCYAGDVNNDGLPDLAVAYLGHDTVQSSARIYLNDSGTLGAAPWWKAHDRHTSFDCCLGDVDLDGHLDLAISAGDAYSGRTDSVRIYHNNGGSFDALPFWTAHEGGGTFSDAVRFCDIDNDGDLDLFVGHNRQISMYRNNGGTLEQTPSWVARAGVGWVLRLAFADYDNDGFLDLAVACNNQIGSPNCIKVYHNNGGTLDTIASFTMLQTDRYASCVAWGDVNGDGYPDLAVGKWYGPVMVFENHAGVLDTTPAWSWVPSDTMNLVCEALVFGDLRNGHVDAVTEAFDGDGHRKLFNLHRRPIQFLDSVCVGGVRVPVAGFCSDPLMGWVSFASAPPSGTANVVFFYRYSTAPDLAVTNWDQSHGSYVFLNTTAGVTGPPKPIMASRMEAWPNPTAGLMKIVFSRAATMLSRTIAVYDMAGRVRCTLSGSDGTWTWDGRDDKGGPVEPGVYFARLGSASPALKIVRVSQR